MRFSALLFLLTMFLPAQASAQDYPSRKTGNRGFINELSVGYSGLSGKGSSDYPVGGGILFSSLFKANPFLAFGLHAGVNGATSSDGYGDIFYGVLAAEVRVYLPIGRLAEIWGSAVFGGALLNERWSSNSYYQDSGDTRTGPVFGTGAGIGFYISPRTSIGGYFRLYRLLWNDDNYISMNDRQVSETDYYGYWWSLGGYIAVHF